MVRRGSVPASKAVYLHLLPAANEPTFNLHKSSRIFKRDVSLSYRLLRYLNSAAFAFRTEIHSIPHALGLLGEVAMRDRNSTRLNSSHQIISYAVFCLKKKKNCHIDDYQV